MTTYDTSKPNEIAAHHGGPHENGGAMQPAYADTADPRYAPENLKKISVHCRVTLTWELTSSDVPGLRHTRVDTLEGPKALVMLYAAEAARNTEELPTWGGR